MKKCWWIHPDLKKGSKVKTKDIPFEEKQFGINDGDKIEPLSEELEKSYLKASKDGFFESYFGGRRLRNRHFDEKWK